MVGNALEVREAIETLNGKGPKDLEDLCCNLGAELFLFAEKETRHAEAIAALRGLLHDGSALTKFQEMVENQGGDANVVNNPSLLPTAAKMIEVNAPRSGTVAQLDALAIGQAANLLGAGRFVKEDTIDPAVGVELRRRVGDAVKSDELLAILHVNEETNLTQACTLVESAYAISKDPVTPPALIVERVTAA